MSTLAEDILPVLEEVRRLEGVAPPGRAWRVRTSDPSRFIAFFHTLSSREEHSWLRLFSVVQGTDLDEVYLVRADEFIRLQEPAKPLAEVTLEDLE